jgi:hypothetical protein
MSLSVKSNQLIGAKCVEPIGVPRLIAKLDLEGFVGQNFNHGTNLSN